MYADEQTIRIEAVLCNLHFLADPVFLKDLSHGNMNKLTLIESSGSFFLLKQPRLNISLGISDINAPAQRILIEANTLSYWHSKQQTLFPDILYIHEDPPFMISEFFSDATAFCDANFKMQTSVIRQLIAPFIFAKEITDTEEYNFAHRYAISINQMSSIISLVTFDLPGRIDLFPYLRESIVYREHLLSLLPAIERNASIKSIRSFASNAYHAKARSLIHGDLHMGSILMSGGGPKIIDAEFAGFKNVCFDAGVLAAHWFLCETTRWSSACTTEMKDTARQILGVFADAFKEIDRSKEVRRDIIKTTYSFFINELFAKLLGPVSTPFISNLSIVRQIEYLSVLIEFMRQFVEEESYFFA